jgi:DNA N-6-adenine-methyltransferase (Dam)
MIDARTEKSRDDWETPSALLHDVCHVFGGAIDFDPFCHSGNAVALKGCKFDKGQDGFCAPWLGRNVFVNSPYGRVLPEVVRAIGNNLLDEHCEAVIQLCPARFGSGWFIDAANGCSALCVLDKRPTFTLNGEPARDKQGKPTTAQFDCALIYYGPSPERFHAVFASKATFWRVQDV